MEAGRSPSVFLGRRRESVTTYEYVDGLLVRSVTVTDPEWTEKDRSAVAAFVDYRESIHSCGRSLSESLRVDGQPPPRYVVGEQECAACKALASHTKKHHGDGVPPEKVLQVFTLAEAQEIARAQRPGVEG